MILNVKYCLIDCKGGWACTRSCTCAQTYTHTEVLEVVQLLVLVHLIISYLYSQKYMYNAQSKLLKPWHLAEKIGTRAEVRWVRWGRGDYGWRPEPVVLSRYSWTNMKSRCSRIPGFQLRSYSQVYCSFEQTFYHVINLVAFNVYLHQSSSIIWVFRVTL